MIAYPPPSEARCAAISALHHAGLHDHAARLTLRREREDMKRIALYLAHLVYAQRATRRHMDALALLLDIADEEDAGGMVRRSLAHQWARHERRSARAA